jgi:hypothetical protein
MTIACHFFCLIMNVLNIVIIYEHFCLADDMGLGKTLTMLALILRCKELNQDDQENLNLSGQEG